MNLQRIFPQIVPGSAFRPRCSAPDCRADATIADMDAPAFSSEAYYCDAHIPRQEDPK